jgi:hypothetical protein
MTRKAHNWRACDLMDCLQTPGFTKSEANLPIVSGRRPECSRFRETGAGDRVRSPLGGGGRSQPWAFFGP